MPGSDEFYVGVTQVDDRQVVTNLEFDCSQADLDFFCTASDFQEMLFEKITLSNSVSCNSHYTQMTQYADTDIFMHNLLEALQINLTNKITTLY